MKSRVLSRLGPVLSFSFFLVALGVLHHAIGTLQTREILQSLGAVPAKQLLLVIAITLFNYFVMTGYDTLAFRYVRHKLQYRKIALASFLGYAFSNSIGLSMITGGSVRYRFYSSWGLHSKEIAKVIAFCTLTVWVGLFASAGIVFLAEPVALPQWLHLPFVSARPVGMMLLSVLGAYVLLTLLRKRPLSVFGWEFPMPSVNLSSSQILISSLDWTLAGFALYLLLPSPHTLPFSAFLGIYLLGQVAGLISQVPGGLGVFESVLVLSLAPSESSSTVLASLLAFRAIYYLLPLCMATALLGLHELLDRRAGIGRTLGVLGRIATWLVRRILPS